MAKGNRRKDVTQNDVAMAAGVSQAAVAHVLQGSGKGRIRVGEKTAARIRDAAEQLGYRPNLLIRAMRQGKTGTIGVILPLNREFHGLIFSGIHDRLAEDDCVAICVWHGWADMGRFRESQVRRMHQLIDRRVDGLILCPAGGEDSTAFVKEVVERRYPLVVVGVRMLDNHADFVGSDDVGVGRQAAEHLLGLGHRRLGFLPGRDGDRSTTVERLRGFRKTVQAAGGTCAVAAYPEATHVGNHAGAVAAAELLGHSPRPTAVFAETDHLARHLYEAAGSMGLRIPQDLSVMGANDLKLSQYLTPPLTTLREQPYQMGHRAAEMLLERINGTTDAKTPREVRLGVELVERQSTAPSASA